jgi:predicted Zn finger-like uncharacterized protein
MSMITRCPACKTSFRVVPDQLRISDGWVRCGQCQEVFDANAALIDAAAALSQEVATPTPTQPEPASSAPVVAGAWADQSEANVQALLEQELPDLPPDISLDFGAGDQEIAATLEPMADSSASQSPLPSAPSSFVEVPNAQFGETAILPHEQLAQEARQDASFMRKMPAKASGPRRVFNVFLGLLALGLLAGLVLQAAVHERDRIAAMFPQTKPALAWICGQLNCTVSNLRQIESVVIDSTSFNKVRGDAYRLSLSLRNTSPLEIAMPALELSLTDSQDQPVMRRVILAPEYSGAATLGAAAEWSGSVTVAVRGNGSERFSGYRVLAFYP